MSASWHVKRPFENGCLQHGGDEVHALAVAQLWVVQGVGGQAPAQALLALSARNLGDFGHGAAEVARNVVVGLRLVCFGLGHELLEVAWATAVTGSAVCHAGTQLPHAAAPVAGHPRQRGRLQRGPEFRADQLQPCAVRECFLALLLRGLLLQGQHDHVQPHV